MPACSSNFQRAFDVFLALYVTEIAVVIAQAVVKLFAGVYNFAFKLGFAVEEVGHMAKTFYAIHFQFIHNGGFAGVLFWEDKAFEAILTCLYGYGQCAFYGLQAAIKRKFAHNEVFVQIFIFPLSG